jgi:hypothetical protein
MFVFNKYGTRKYKFLLFGEKNAYFVQHHSDRPHKYAEADIKSMLGFLVDTMYVVLNNL